MRPAFISDEAWHKIFSNFLAQTGNPLEDLSGVLQDDVDRLEEMGFASPSVMAALSFRIEQSGDFGSLAARASEASMGFGWYSLADIKLNISSKGMIIEGLVDANALIALDAERTAQYAISLSLGKIIGQNGSLIDGASFSRPIFTLEDKSDDGMTLLKINDSYHVTTKDGGIFIFNESGRLESFVSSGGYEVVALYDVNGRLFRYEDNAGSFVEFSYDGLGRIASVVDADGGFSNYTYSLSNELTLVDALSGETTLTYDGNSNLLTAEPNGGPALAFTYDAEGRLNTQSIGGIGESYAYNSSGAITITNSLSEEIVLQIGPGGHVASMESNIGQTATVTTNLDTRSIVIGLPDGTSATLTYDDSGRLLSATNGNDDSVYFSYQAETGRLISFTDAGGNVREFEYNSSGLITEARWGNDKSFSFGYDINGNLIEFTNRRGELVEYDYDGRGRVVEASDSASGLLSYAYDLSGNISSITTSAGVTSISYDAGNRIALIEYPNGRSLAYTYDNEGKRLSMINQDNEGTFYAYKISGQLESISDNNGILTSYTYDGAGRLVLEQNANGTYTEYGYDGAGRVNEIKNYDSSLAVNSFFQYEYDALDRKIAVITNDGDWSYSYDGSGQLTEAIFTSTTVGIPNASYSYEYDAAGNRVSVTDNGITTNYTTNALNQYESVGGKIFSYDDDGNLVSQSATANSYAYVYGVDNRLMQVTRPDSTVITYEYDSFGNRSAMVDNGIRTEFLIDPFGYGNVVAEYDGVGSRIATYAYGLGLASRTDSSGNLAFFDVDGSGSVVGMTDSLGVTANKYIYSPFGDELHESETISNSFEFNGAYGVSEDADNLLYMRARTYDVELGRFLSEDPLFMSGDFSNLYRFAGNDPLQYGDPDGERRTSWTQAASKAAGKVGKGVGIWGIGAAIIPLGMLTSEFVKTDDPHYKKALAQEMLGYLPDLFMEFLGVDELYNTAEKLNELAPKGGGNGNSDDGGDGRADGGNGGGGGGGGGGGVPLNPPERPNPDNKGSPLVVDLDGDGIELYETGAYGTYFDLRNNGQAVLTGWVEPDDGLLAIDTNENGVIDNVSELFGTQTSEGFSILKLLDSNADGKIDSSDASYDKLLVWRDLNSDGVSQANELYKLSDLGITSISLDSKRVFENIEGNTITHESTFVINGNEHKIVDAWFAFDPSYTRNATEYNFDIRTAFLPSLKGYGDLKDLHIAASMDNNEANPSSLMARLLDLAGNVTLDRAFSDWDSLYSEVEALLWRWAGVEGVNPAGRGSYVDGQHMAFYEEFRGYPFKQYGNSNPLIEAGQFVEDIYDYLVMFHTMQIILQVAGAEIYEGAGYSIYSGTSTGNLNLVQSGIDAIKDAAILSTDAEAVWTRFAQFIGYTKGFSNLTTAEVSALDAAVSATSEPSLNDWQDVVSLMIVSLGPVIDDSGDWAAHEVYYDNLTTGTNGNDTITDNNAGGWHNNEFKGLDGNDIIDGGDGHDKIIGGAGSDTLIGGSGDDYLLGGSGDDLYHYESGNDTISEVGGSGYDELHILASTGLTTSNMTDMYRYGNELIILLSTGSYITIDGYSGTNSRIEKIVFDSNGSYIDLAAIMEEKFYGTAQADDLTVSGESVQTLLVYGYAGNDTIVADGAAAKFYGGDGYDTLIGDYLPDFLYGDAQDDYLSGAGGNDTLSGGDGNDTLLGGDGLDTLSGGEGDDMLSGGDGADTISGGNGNDYLLGGNGADTMTGGYGDDIHDGGAGNDWMEGFYGNDVYIFGRGYGQDTAYDRATTAGSDSRMDEIRFLPDVLPSDIIVGRASESGIILTISGTTDSITLREQEFHAYDITQIERVTFANGTLWTDDDLVVMALATQSTSGDDVIYGFKQRNDVITGGLGNDTLHGIDGNDTYIFGLGDGQDIIKDSGGYNNLTFLAGINPGDVIVSRNSSDSIILSISGTTDTVTLFEQELEFYSDHVEEVRFSDTTVWTDAILRAKAIEFQATSGNDTVTAFKSNDIVMGGAGNDWLNGREGDDTYIYNLGDGQDTFQDLGGHDTIQMGAGINAGHLTQTRTGDDLLITISAAPSSSILIKNHYAGSSKVIEKIVFDDSSVLNISPRVVGTSGNDTITGTSSADLIYGLEGDDTINGGSGNDELHGDEGNDTINGAAGADTIFGESGNDTLNGGNDNDYIEGNDGDDIIDGGNQNDTILGGAGNDTIRGGWHNDNISGDDGNDFLYGGFEHDVISGGLGDDYIDGESGTDTVSYINSLTAVSVDLLTGIATGEGTDTLVAIERIEGSQFGDTLVGNNAVNTINGMDGNDIIDGNAGDDILNGGLGDDTYLVAYGDDEDYVTDEGGYDILQFTGTVTAENLDFFTENHDSGAVADDVKVDFNNTSVHEVVIYDQLSTTFTDRKIEEIRFADGFSLDFRRYGSSQWVQVGNSTTTQNESAATEARTILGGTNGNTITGSAYGDQIHADTGNDTIHGGAGDDWLHGGTGVDIVNGDAGNDIIYGGLGNDTLNGGADVDTVVYLSSAAAVTVNLSTGTATGEGTDTLSNFENIIGSSYNDTLTGDSGNNTIHAGSGNDTVTGGDGSDTLYGQDGNDTLYGGSGNDYLYGGFGADSMTGNAGADTFVFEKGSAYQAVDTITDFSIGEDDVLDLSDLLFNYDPLTDAITDFVQISTSGSDSTISVDVDGAGGIYSFVQIATLTGVTGVTDETALVTSGNLLVA